MELLFQLGVFVTLPLVGLVFGRAHGPRPLRQLQPPEAQRRGGPGGAARTPPPDREFRGSAPVVGSGVAARDLF